MADPQTSDGPSIPPPPPPASDSTTTYPQPSLPRPSTSSTHSNDEILPPEAAAALAGVHAPIDDMEQVGHRRRRSSLMNDLNTGAQTSVKTRSPLADSSSIAEEAKPGDIYDNSSTSDDMELEDLSGDEGLQDDEETGLTGKDRSRRKRKKRKNTLLDQRVANDVRLLAEISEEEKKEADQHVLKKGLINGSLIGLWYLFSLSISIYNKWMFGAEHLDFHFPLFTTCMHMVIQFSLSSLVLWLLPQFRPRYDSISNPHRTYADGELMQHNEDSKKPLMTPKFYATRLGPCGTATGLDIGLGNMSLKFPGMTLTFYTMCKSSALGFVLIFAFIFRLETPSWKLVGIIATMTAGVILMVAGEVSFSAIGFVLVISAAFFSGFRWALTQILLLRNPATSNPFSSIFFLAPIMFLSLLIIAIPVEGFPELWEGLHILIEKKGPILGPLLLVFPGCMAFCMTASEFALLQRTSVVTLSIAGIFKEVLTIAAGGIVFDDRLTPVNVSGLFVTLGAIAAYNWIKIRKMREDARIEAHNQHAGVDGSVLDSESEEEDWNTVEGSYVTADGDIMPNTSYKKVKKGSSSSSSSNDNPGVAGPAEQAKPMVKEIAAIKRELSD